MHVCCAEEVLACVLRLGKAVPCQGVEQAVLQDFNCRPERRIACDFEFDQLEAVLPDSDHEIYRTPLVCRAVPETRGGRNLIGPVLAHNPRDLSLKSDLGT